MLGNIVRAGLGKEGEERPRLPADIPSHTRPVIPGGFLSRIVRFRFAG